MDLSPGFPRLLHFPGPQRSDLDAQLWCPELPSESLEFSFQIHANHLFCNTVFVFNV